MYFSSPDRSTKTQNKMLSYRQNSSIKDVKAFHNEKNLLLKLRQFSLKFWNTVWPKKLALSRIII